MDFEYKKKSCTILFIAMKKKSLIVTLLGLIAVSCFIYISFFAYRIRAVSRGSYRDSREYKYHVLVGVTESNADYAKEFYEGTKYICPVFDAAVELLETSPEDIDSLLDYWIEYARFVDADGLILYSGDDTLSSKKLIGLHEKEIPVVIAGECSTGSQQVSHVTSSKYELGKLAFQEIIDGGWKKPVAIVRKNYQSDQPYRIISAIERNMPQQKKIKIHNLVSEEVIDDEVRNVLMQYAQNDSADVIITFTAEETNLIAQTIVDQNITDKLSVIGFSGDKKTLDYIKKGIVSANIYADPWEMGAASAEELFKWKSSGFSNNYRQIVPKIRRGTK